MDMHLCIGSIVFVLIATIVAYTLSFLTNGPFVKPHCGRKSAFTGPYGLFLYYNEIAGYFFGLICNALAYGFATRMMTSRSVSVHIGKIRFSFVITLISCILIALPNVISVIATYVGKSLPIEVTEPADWLSSINSSKNIFVYYFMAGDFHSKIKKVLNSKHWTPKAIAVRPTSKLKSASRTENQFFLRCFIGEQNFLSNFRKCVACQSK